MHGRQNCTGVQAGELPIAASRIACPPKLGLHFYTEGQEDGCSDSAVFLETPDGGVSRLGAMMMEKCSIKPSNGQTYVLCDLFDQLSHYLTHYLSVN